MTRAKVSAEEYIPKNPTLAKLKEAAQHCRACPLYENATQAVMGEGPRGAKLFFIGEQPGDVEDKQGRPFVGPAGRLLDTAFADAGIDRSSVYLTNAVKHFKFEERGKRRIHKKPNASEVEACRPWLMAELSLVKPKLIVCLGATAAQAMLGKAFRVTQSRGVVLPQESGISVLATVHPSALLRVTDSQDRAEQYGRFVEDLRRAREYVST
jgi:DNA polymerase